MVCKDFFNENASDSSALNGRQGKTFNPLREVLCKDEDIPVARFRSKKRSNNVAGYSIKGILYWHGQQWCLAAVTWSLSHGTVTAALAATAPVLYVAEHVAPVIPDAQLLISLHCTKVYCRGCLHGSM